MNSYSQSKCTVNDCADMTQVPTNAEEFHKEYTTKVIRKESRTGINYFLA
jgi:hypothetical protein